MQTQKPPKFEFRKNHKHKHPRNSPLTSHTRFLASSHCHSPRPIFSPLKLNKKSSLRYSSTMKLSTMILAMMVALEHERRRRRKRIVKHSRYRKDFYLTLSDESKRVRQRRLPRMSLLSPHNSPWRKLYNSQSDQGMITLTGFDYVSFNALSKKFACLFNKYTPFKKDDNTIVLKTSHRGRKGD
jgi:hypothetical protein